MTGAMLAVLLFAQTAPAQDYTKDTASEDAILGALYEVISGDVGVKRDWARFRNLFAPGARLIPIGGAQGARVLTPDDYANVNASRLEETGFHEREIARKTERFGNLVHVFSTYESKRKLSDEKPFARGINSIQLRYDGKRWWVQTVMWESERAGNPIPAAYLK